MSKVSNPPAGGKISSDPESVEAEALRALGLSPRLTMPTEETEVADLFMYALVPYIGAHPVHGIVLGVAAELEALAMFMEGPLSITLEMLARRLRAAVDLSRRIRGQKPPEGAASAEVG